MFDKQLNYVSIVFLKLFLAQLFIKCTWPGKCYSFKVHLQNELVLVGWKVISSLNMRIKHFILNGKCLRKAENCRQGLQLALSLPPPSRAGQICPTGDLGWKSRCELQCVLF